MAEFTLYGKRKLCYTEVTDFTDFQGIGRDPLYKRFDSVYSVIEKNIEPQYIDFLAHPIYSDEDQILWYVREWGGTPCQFKDLSDDDRTRYAEIKDKTIAAYEQLRKNLSGEDKQILTGALKYIDEDFMFCYDDKIVVVAWGMLPDSRKHVVKGAVMHDLKIQNSHKIKFMVGEHGALPDKLAGIVSRPDGSTLSLIDLPVVTPKRGYAFKGWDPNPLGVKVDGPLVFNAMYEEVDLVNLTFVASDGGTLSGITDMSVVKGDCLNDIEVPTPIPNIGYSFAGWDLNEDAPIECDTVCTATFERSNVSCVFVAGENGVIEGDDNFSLPYGTILNKGNVPTVTPKKGYKFIGWDQSPIDYVLNGDTTFRAQFEKVLPWYKRLWLWLTGKGCLKWLLCLLLILLLLFLLSYLLRDYCPFNRSDRVIESSVEQTPDGRTIDNNGSIKDILGEDGRLPDDNVVAPILGDDGIAPPIISNPGAPDIIANRLNIYFDSQGVDLDKFVSDLLKVLPADQCKVIGVDRRVPMLQILIPESMRDAIRDGLNAKLPNYQFFIVDESIFTLGGRATTNNANVGWHLDAIDLEEGWSVTKGSPEVIVAVVDDGIDASHEIIRGRIVKPYNVFTQNNRLSVGTGHGTHVAGLAVGSDKKFREGISGVAPRCKLMPVQVFDNDNCTFSSLISGIMYAIHNGASVVNVSIAPTFRGLDVLPISDQDYIARTQFKNEERVWKRVISVANDHNVILVFAVGNDNVLASIPPENRTNFTVNVAAVGPEMRETDFTNFGPGSNISAPGAYVISSMPTNNYAAQDGTSMAAPIVAGTIALMKSISPNVSVMDVLHILQATGEYVSQYIPPMIQVDDALIALKTGVIPEVAPRADATTEDPVCSEADRYYSDNDSYTTEPPVETPVVRGVPVEETPVKGYTYIEDNRGYVGDAPKGGGGSVDRIVIPAEPAPGRGTPGNGYVETPISDKHKNGTDYDAIRRLIESYKRKINELEKLLPENN